VTRLKIRAVRADILDLPNLTAGCELFGPLWLADDIVEESVAIRDGQVWLSEGQGIGVRLDEQKVRRYLRA